MSAVKTDHYGNPFTIEEGETEEQAYVKSNWNHIKELSKHYDKLYGPKREVLEHNNKNCLCQYCKKYRETGYAM